MSSSSCAYVFSVIGSLFRQPLLLCIQVCHFPLVLCVWQVFEWALGLPTLLIFRVCVFRTMPPKSHGSKAPIKESSSKIPKGARDENLPINPPIQPPSIPKAPAKTFIDGIPFNVFQAKFCRDQYTKVYPQRSLVIERQLHLDFFLNIPILELFVKLGWLSLATFTGIACAPIVQMFYLNIIEHDLDESYL